MNLTPAKKCITNYKQEAAIAKSNVHRMEKCLDATFEQKSVQFG
jgi:hypothetical protein